MSTEEEVDVFRVLSHPLRRKILVFIAEKGGASYKDLTKIVPKPGALYHHLRLLGDLIYQDKNKIYHLTKKGEMVYQFLVSEFFVPEDKSIHKILTPRIYLEQIEGIVAGIFLGLFFLSSLIWLLAPDLIPIFLLVITRRYSIPNIVIVYVNFFCATLIMKILIRLVYSRSVHLFDLMAKLSPTFILINFYPMLFMLIEYKWIFFSLYLIMQFFAILLALSGVSVVSRLHLRSSLTIVLILHYISLLIVMIVLGFITLPF